MGDSGFNLSTVFSTLAQALPEHRVLFWRGRQWTYAETDARVDGIAHYLTSLGLGCHTERDRLQGHESGQDHIGLYLRNGNQYLESMIGAYRARVAPFNVNYRYVDAELVYLLANAQARALVYNAEFAPRVSSIRDQLPQLEFLIQVADDSGRPLLPGAVDYESVIETPAPPAGMPTPSGDDLYMLYTGGTTGMPKGVLWRQNDVFVSSMGGRPFGSDEAMASYDEVAARASGAPGFASVLLIPPLMHGAAQWGAFQIMTMGGWVTFPDDVHSIRADEILRLVDRERVMSIPVVGDAIARPLIDEIERGDYDLSGLVSISNGGAALTPSVRKRFTTALPNLLIIDTAGASETGLQMSAMPAQAAPAAVATFTPGSETGVVAADFSRQLGPGGGEGWLARRNMIPLGYLGDAEKTARTFPVVDGVRWSIPGDRARLLADGRIELLGRDAVTINSGGEKIFAEEVEAAMAEHPGIYDVVVTGRPSQRWGQEVVAIVQLVEGRDPSDEELLDTCQQHIARYKLPKAIIRTSTVQRSPAGKADYRWAKQVAAENPSTTTGPG
ncbi:acyl-CoA synthetase [Mycobacterium montefiorense]|uniref:Acyl-CoA synthetase n=1 Tax=Mycobacterium montefiorense TaxID=154654 RepID=A0AA37UTL8_9MYCO|nr:acyl-CoA synthetase [Mycobacterium montefiorense]GBG38830.1 acyl-CoA synthetase [Mycobacterium montefiorense]GKU34658.1 acyl-CoA synthetase [Mycobacterium montefiorense]GKU38139.1 acyl-CoA synthetase [Mycobacterium montefiorense]GKU43427.1 acyl-CoA synthetase [Mycobacterium montefiorense]GKU50043.1 acyl-CoA synthetase [Mycobacterium montefiorense]